MNEPTTSGKAIVRKRTLDEAIQQMHLTTHPFSVKKAAEKELEGVGELEKGLTPDTELFKALTMREFDEGMLVSLGFPEHNRTFCIDLSHKLQKEYEAKGSSERATAHLAAQSYTRIIELQRKINSYLEKGEITDMGVRYLGVLSKEMDRAQRHYYSAIQTLQAMKQPQINLTVKANQANFAQNMAVQQKGEYESK